MSKLILRRTVRPVSLIVALSGASPAFAADHLWIANVPTLFQANGWQGGPPTSNAANAVFDVDAAFAGSGTGAVLINFQTMVNNALFVREGLAGLDFGYFGSKATYQFDTITGSDSVVVGTIAGKAATLTIVGSAPFEGATDEILSNKQVVIGSAAGSSGVLNLGQFQVGPMKWTGSDSTYVGRLGTGTLNLAKGSTYIDAGALIGSGAGSHGTANIEGKWTNNGGLFVGVGGSGALVIGDSAVVNTTGGAVIAAFPGITGTATIGGLGEWTIGGKLFVGGSGFGQGGTGLLNVNGGTVSADALEVFDPGTVNVAGGMLSIANAFTLGTGSRLNLSAGTLVIAFDQMSVAANAFHWTGGTVQTAGGMFIQTGNPLLGGALTLGNNMGLVANAITVGLSANGSLTMNSGSFASSESGFIGSMFGTGTTATVNMNGTAEWSLGGTLNIFDETAANLSLASGARIDSFGLIASAATGGGHSNISLSGAGTYWDDNGDAFFGGVVSDKNGDGLLSITTGAKLAVANVFETWSRYDVALDGGILEAGSMELLGDFTALGTSNVKAGSSLAIAGGAKVNFAPGAVFDVQGTTVSVTGGAQLTGDLTGDAATAVTVSGAGTKWAMPGGLEIGTTSAGLGHLGSLRLNVGTTTTSGGIVKVLDATKFTFDGATLNAQSVELGAQNFSGWGTINAKFHTTGNVTATGDLTMGDAASVSGVVIGGALDVGSHHVTINKKGFYVIGNDTSIAGGTLSAHNGLALAVGTSLAAAGTLDGRIAAQAGSTIEATGDLAMGDAGSLAGYFSDGELAVGKYQVTLHDANAAVLGSLTTLEGGTLSAGNGLLVEFDKNVSGHGTIDTRDDVLHPFLNNGDVRGDSAAAPIVMTGYVKGVGHFDNVVFAGTYSPGLSPSIVHVGSVVYDAGSTLVMELAGLAPGAGGYDQIIHDGTATLGGTLDIHLLDGFLPAAGESFTLMLAAQIAEGSDFASVIFPQVAGVAFALERTATSLTLKASAVPLPPAVLLLAPALLVMRRRGG